MRNRPRFAWFTKVNWWTVIAMLAVLPFANLPTVAQEVADAPVAESEADDSPATDQPPSEGLADLDEALKMKVTSSDLRDLNKVIERLEIAIDKGLNDDDMDFAEQMLSDSLMERATSLMQVINSRSILDDRVKKIRALVTSDLRDVLAYGEPPASAYLMLGKLQSLPGGDPREARRAIGSFLKFDDLPDEQRAEALVLRARMIKDQNKAVADMREAIRLAPENTTYALALAVYLRQANKLDDALATIEEVRTVDPENANALILQGEIYRQQERIEEALASLDKATELAPQAPAPYQSRGEIYRKQEENDKAIEQFNEVLKLQPGSWRPLLNRADAYMALGKLEEALADVELVLEKQPLVAAHHVRAEILTKMDRLDEAVQEMERVSAAMPEQPELKMQLALYYIVDKQLSKAIESYSDVLDQHPDVYEALQARGDLYLNIGKHAEAIVDFTRALKLRPDNTTLLNNLAWVLATSPEDDLRDGEKAVELATKACELTDYKTPHILSTLAAAFAEEGNFETAIKWSQEAVSLDDPVHAEQLAKELESYREGHPWRERQEMEEKEPQPPLEDSIQQQLNEFGR